MRPRDGAANSERRRQDRRRTFDICISPVREPATQRGRSQRTDRASNETARAAGRGETRYGRGGDGEEACQGIAVRRESRIRGRVYDRVPRLVESGSDHAQGLNLTLSRTP